MGSQAAMEMQRCLRLLWLATVLLAAFSDGNTVGEVDAVAIGDATPVGLNVHEEDLRSSTVLADLGAGKDACTGAYKKFKAEISKMSTLKKKAEKKVGVAKRSEKKAKGKLKCCKKGQKEVTAKANWKKAKIKRHIDDRYKKKIAAYKKKEKKRTTAAKKKTAKIVKGAKKKASTATSKMKH